MCEIVRVAGGEREGENERGVGEWGGREREGEILIQVWCTCAVFLTYIVNAWNAQGKPD